MAYKLILAMFAALVILGFTRGQLMYVTLTEVEDLGDRFLCTGPYEDCTFTLEQMKDGGDSDTEGRFTCGGADFSVSCNGRCGESTGAEGVSTTTDGGAGRGLDCLVFS